ncbi:hypothetical protein [Methanosarcina mazei]|uniref:hypothetical protein n=1 Tax=Methanosarcina mazei TaxID=2209 RepID=UPI00064E949E|nr:hypothetical protein [Methanosarcina mazei]
MKIYISNYVNLPNVGSNKAREENPYYPAPFPGIFAGKILRHSIEINLFIFSYTVLKEDDNET